MSDVFPGWMNDDVKTMDPVHLVQLATAWKAPSIRRDEARQELVDRLALRDQQVTLAMCNEAVFDINPVDPDFGLIDKEQVERALAQLPWPHGSGEG